MFNRTKVLTASPEELRLMLLDGAIKFASQGREGMAARNYEASFNGISQCRNIVLELLTTIKPEYDPELCDRVKSLYTFLYTQLVESSMEKNITKLDAVIKLLQYERETWVLLMGCVLLDAMRAWPGARRASESPRARDASVGSVRR